MSASYIEHILQIFSPKQKAPEFLDIEEKNQFSIFSIFNWSRINQWKLDEISLDINFWQQRYCSFMTVVKRIIWITAHKNVYVHTLSLKNWSFHNRKNGKNLLWISKFKVTSHQNKLGFHCVKYLSVCKEGT